MKSEFKETITLKIEVATVLSMPSSGVDKKFFHAPAGLDEKQYIAATIANALRGVVNSAVVSVEIL